MQLFTLRCVSFLYLCLWGLHVRVNFRRGGATAIAIEKSGEYLIGYLRTSLNNVSTSDLQGEAGVTATISTCDPVARRAQCIYSFEVAFSTS